MNSIWKAFCCLGLVFLMAAAPEANTNTSTIKGKVVKVVPHEKEIYVEADGQKHEYYFKPETTLTQNGKTVEFSALKEGQNVEVTALKVGKRFDPTSVKILE